MAAPPVPAPTETETAKPKRSRKRTLVLVGVLVVLLAVGFVFVKPRLSSAAPKVDPATVAGAVVTLDPITLNLSDGRFLKTGIALQLSEKATTTLTADATAKGQAAGSGTPLIDGAKALDAAISVLGSRSYAQLLPAGGRAKAQAALNDEVVKRYDGQVLKVYFTEFVMQ